MYQKWLSARGISSNHEDHGWVLPPPLPRITEVSVHSAVKPSGSGKHLRQPRGVPYRILVGRICRAPANGWDEKWAISLRLGFPWVLMCPPTGCEGERETERQRQTEVPNSSHSKRWACLSYVKCIQRDRLQSDISHENRCTYPQHNLPNGI